MRRTSQSGLRPDRFATNFRRRCLLRFEKLDHPIWECVSIPIWNAVGESWKGNHVKMHLKIYLFLLALGTVSTQAQFAHLTMQSQPGDYIGQGLSYDITYTPANSYYFSPQVRSTLPSG